MMNAFKICPHCGKTWPSRALFLEDADLEVIGYQVDFEDIERGLFLFNHHDCKTTLAIPAVSFKDLHHGPFFSERQTGSKSCPGYCLRQHELEACPAECACAWVRDVLQTIRQAPKASRASQAATAAHR
jgi:hypothetical protein